MQRAVAAVLAAQLAGCVSGFSDQDPGPPGCALRAAPSSSHGAPARLGTLEPLPLPPGAITSQSPLAAVSGGQTVVVFQSSSGVAATTTGASSFLVAPGASSPALAALGSRIYLGWISAGALVIALSDDVQGVPALAGGGGRRVPIALPAGAHGPAQLTLAAAGSDLIAAFTASQGGRTQVLASRLRNADCAACTLGFDAAVAVGPGTSAEEFPQVALGAHGAVAVSFVRPLGLGLGEVWLAEGTLGAGALSLREAPAFAGVSGQAAPIGFFADGSLAVAYGGPATPAADAGTADAGTSDAGTTASTPDVVVRRVASGIAAPAVRANDDDTSLFARHAQPGLAIDAEGRLYVAWYDTRFTAGCGAAVLLARSLDQGRSFSPNALVTPDGEAVPFDAGPPAAPVTVQSAGGKLFIGSTGALGGAARAELAAGAPP